jgi:hypothetical protein
VEVAIFRGALEDFLKRNAVRERRIDNVGAAFVWLEHLFGECVANPTNVSLGVAEWFADHADRYWRARGHPWLADEFAKYKVALDDMRVTVVPMLRFRIYDLLERNARPKPGPPDTLHPAAPPPMTFPPQGPPAGS